MDFRESEERQALRQAAAALGARYGRAYLRDKVRAGGKTDELWSEAGRLGYLGVNLPEEHGGGGGGIGDLAAVCEELGAAGCPLLLMVVSPAICGTVISRFGTGEQRKRWLPGIADGTLKMVFAITEPDAGSNVHRLTSTARRDGEEWLLSGQKVFISGVDEAQSVLVVARAQDARTGRLKPALYVVPTDAPGVQFQQIEMELASPEKQFTLFFDQVRLPRQALIGDDPDSADAGLRQLFAGLNPERIMAASFSLGIARHALDRAVAYAKDRTVFSQPIGAHQGVAHPLAQCAVELQLAQLMTQKAAWLYDNGDGRPFPDQASLDGAGRTGRVRMAAGEAANMAKYAAAEVAAKTVDQAVQTHGGNGLTVEYGVAGLLAASRAGRIAPVSREMVLNFVATHTLGLPKSY